MRGKAVRCSRRASRSRITPAHAGKRAWRRWRAASDKDHPRTCGEKIYSVRDNIAEQGSPPRMRGKAVLVTDHAQNLRITPAYAGKSISVPEMPDAVGDHPRVCGEKAVCLIIRQVIVGSPPRMRGKVLSGLATWLPIGITPAYAGKSSAFRLPSCSLWDHPRVCGEKQMLYDDC